MAATRCFALGASCYLLLEKGTESPARNPLWGQQWERHSRAQCEITELQGETEGDGDLARVGPGKRPCLCLSTDAGPDPHMD